MARPETENDTTTPRPWLIRPASAGDIAALTDFNCAIAVETEDRELDRDLVRNGVKRGLQQGEEVRYLVADIDDTVIGQLMLTREWSDWRDGWVAWIQSVYVHADHRGRGVFRALLQHATEMLKANPDVVGIRLYVETENERAQTVYARTGFKDPKYKVLEMMF